MRPYVAAYAYLLGGFDAFHRLGGFNRLALAGACSAATAVERGARPLSRRWTRLGLPLGRHGPRTAHGRLRGCCSVNRSARLEDLTDRALERLRADRAPVGPRAGPVSALHRARRGAGRSPPARGAHRAAGRCRCEGASADWIAWVRALVADLDAHTRGPARVPRRSCQGRALAGGASSPTIDGAGGLDARDLRRATSRGRPHAASATTRSAGPASATASGGRSRPPARRPTSARCARSSATARNGAGVRPALRPRDRARHAARRAGPHGPQAARHRRRRSGPRCCGPGSTSRPRTVAARRHPRLSRSNSCARWRSPGCSPASAATRSSACASAASAGSRAMQRRAPAAAPVCLLDVPVHKTGAAFTKPVDRSVGRPSTPGRRSGRRSRRCPTARPAKPVDLLFACRGPAGRPRRTSTTRSSRCSAARPACPPATPAAASPATGRAPPSPASSTTPRSR